MLCLLRVTSYFSWSTANSVISISHFGNMSYQKFFLIAGVPSKVMTLAFWHFAKGTWINHWVCPARGEVSYWDTMSFHCGTHKLFLQLQYKKTSPPLIHSCLLSPQSLKILGPKNTSRFYARVMLILLLHLLKIKRFLWTPKQSGPLSFENT